VLGLLMVTKRMVYGSGLGLVCARCFWPLLSLQASKVTHSVISMVFNHTDHIDLPEQNCIRPEWRLNASLNLPLVRNQDGTCQFGKNAVFNDAGDIVNQDIQAISIQAGIKAHIEHQAAVTGDR